jgi:DNA repair and recombination protein RAD54 and RAD54-like protein
LPNLCCPLRPKEDHQTVCSGLPVPVLLSLPLSLLQHRGKGILIISYETQRRYSAMFHPGPKSALLPYSGSPCELLVCDEAHKLKNSESELAKTLMALPAKKRVLLSGTPMQNELSEFFNMVDFCNPGVLGSSSSFRRTYERPILLSREPDATTAQKQNASRLQKELSTIVNEFILKRGNILNARHLPPKLVQYVCCRNTELQNELYDLVIRSKNLRHLRDGKQMNTLNSLRHLLQITSHPDLILSAHKQKGSQHDEELDELASHILNYYNSRDQQRSSKKGISEGSMAGGGPGGSSGGISRGGVLSGSLSRSDRSAVRASNKGAGGMKSGFDPELSGKFLVLFRLMYVLRQLPTKDRIVIISNSTQTLDLVESECPSPLRTLLSLTPPPSGSDVQRQCLALVAVGWDDQCHEKNQTGLRIQRFEEWLLRFSSFEQGWWVRNQSHRRQQIGTLRSRLESCK